MTEDQDGKDSQSDSSNKAASAKSKDNKKIRSQRPLTKIILRRLPPSMTEESFLEQVSPIPEHDYFYFAKADPSLGNNLFSRAYINFVNVEDIFLFRDKFDGYIFVDDKGGEYVGIVEFALFQRIPKKKKKKDPKCGTIESDPVYQEFIENLNKDPETESQPKLEFSYPINDVSDKKNQSTPLLEYLAARKLDKRGRDDRRRRENDKRKVRIERKGKEGTIKTSQDISEDEACPDEYHKPNNHQKLWSGKDRIYQNSKQNHGSYRNESKSSYSEEHTNQDANWDSHFPALSAKMHSTFTLSSDKCFNLKGTSDINPKSGGDTVLKEEDFGEQEQKKIKSRDWEKEKSSKIKDDGKDVTVYENKSYRDRKAIVNNNVDKKKKDNDKNSIDDENIDKNKKDRKDNLRESPRETKSKKYSDTRKERLKQNEMSKSDKTLKPEVKVTKSMSHDDIKPFTQLPQVKTDDLTKLIEEMDRKVKLDDSDEKRHKSNKNIDERPFPSKDSVEKNSTTRLRKSSSETEEVSSKEDIEIKRQKSLEERSDSVEREGSEEKDRSGNDSKSDRRIRNKDRPSLVIYQPGMGRFSKQRLGKDKDSNTKSVNESEKKDT